MKTKLLIFGITGDLSQRKLLPALGQIVRTGEFDSLEIIGGEPARCRQERVAGEAAGADGADEYFYDGPCPGC